MASGGGSQLQPTYLGHVATTRDALILFEACLRGVRNHVPRRPHDRERSRLIRSGCVFIYEENASGIKRWTDGVPWSPSRILGNFLVYRELLKPFPPGEKKRATKRAKRATKPGEPYPRSGGDAASTSSANLSPTMPVSPAAPATPATPATPAFRPGESFDRETERSLIGSLVDSYGFKEGGLVKKTMSVNVNGVHHHLVSYYKVDDVLNHALEVPSQNSALRELRPRPELTSRQNFRAPLDEMEEGFDGRMDPMRNEYEYGDRGGYDRRPGMGPHGYHHPAHGQPPGPMGYPGVENHHYHGGAPQHMSAAAPGYGVPAPVPPSTQAYYGPSVSAQHPAVKVEEYGLYSGVGAYPPRFDPLHNGLEAGPATPTHRAPPSMTPVTYQQDRQPTRPANGAGDGQVVDNKGQPAPYGRAYYTTGSRPENMGPQYPLQEAQRWHPPPPNVPQRMEAVAGYPKTETGYWPMPGSAPPPLGHYPNHPSVPHWNNPTDQQ